MYRVIVIDEDGKESITDYNFIDVDLVQQIAKQDFETSLSEEELKEVQSYCQDSEELPDTYDISEIISEIIKDRGQFMKKYLVNYTETFTGQIEVEADNEEMANNKVCEMIDSDELVPTERYNGHDITVDFAEEA